MSEKDFCSNCTQKHDCKSIYEHMGNSRTPPVAIRAAIAFLLPIMVFIISLTIAQNSMSGMGNGINQQTAISFLLAACIAFLSTLITKVISDRLAKNSGPCMSKGEKHQN